MKDFVAIGMFVIIPSLIVATIYSLKKNLSDNRTQVILSALEKNPALDIEQFMKTLAPQRKPLRERLINRIHTETLFGWALTLLGSIGMISMLSFGIYSVIIDMIKDGLFVFALCFLPVFALGVGLLLAARQDKKNLAKLQN